MSPQGSGVKPYKVRLILIGLIRFGLVSNKLSLQFRQIKARVFI